MLVIKGAYTGARRKPSTGGAGVVALAAASDSEAVLIPLHGPLVEAGFTVLKLY